jgi:hypothetical protein
MAVIVWQCTMSVVIDKSFGILQYLLGDVNNANIVDFFVAV